MAASMSHYGLGWMSGEYRGLREISHTGGTTGFTAQVAFLPAADLGIAILSNASASPGALAFAFAVQFRLLELLFDQPAEMDAQLSAVARARVAGRPQLASHIDPAAVSAYLGRFTHPTLGHVTITWREIGSLWTPVSWPRSCEHARPTGRMRASSCCTTRRSRSIPRRTGRP